MSLCTPENSAVEKLSIIIIICLKVHSVSFDPLPAETKRCRSPALLVVVVAVAVEPVEAANVNENEPAL